MATRGEKEALRRRLRAAREALPAAVRTAASAAIRRHLAAWPPFRAARTVLIYLPFRGEVDLVPLTQAFPAKVWLAPRVAGRELVLHAYDPRRLRRHRFGMWEPAPDCPVVDPAEVDLALVPALAYDRAGYRLGYGGGYYDRLLPRLGGLAVGVTYQAFLLDALPHDPWDRPVAWVVTEEEVVRARSQG